MEIKGGLEFIFQILGIRPIYIKSVGYFDWSTGARITSENKFVNKLLNKAEIFYVDEHINRNRNWTVKYFSAIDHTGKKNGFLQKRN